MVALENKGLALRLAVDALKDTVDIANVADVEAKVLPVAERFHTWLEGETVSPAAEPAAPERTGADAVEAIRRAIDPLRAQLGGTVEVLVNDGIRTLGGRSYDETVARALDLIQQYGNEIGNRNAGSLRTAVLGVRQ